MAFTASNFIPVTTTNSNGGQLFMYKEDETLGNIDEDDYFNLAYDSYGLRTGDIILVTASDGFGFYKVTITGGDVDIDESVVSS